MTTIKTGCCGFPKGRKEYFRHFSLTEVQQTFYKMPKLETATRWREEAPPDFEFTLKASQLITHPYNSPTYRKAGIKPAPGKESNYGFFRPTEEVHQAWDQTKLFAQALDCKLIVFQCPPSFTETPENIDNLRNFFKPLKESGFTLVWEPRRGWTEETVKSLCEELGLIHCVDPMVSSPLYGKPRYFRLHGGTRYWHRYAEEELAQLKEIATTGDTYVLFNNLNMFNDALAFKQLIEGNE
ncbi:MAG: DUF72 domain-containing protein [Dehalococcoidia bacterium]